MQGIVDKIPRTGWQRCKKIANSLRLGAASDEAGHLPEVFKLWERLHHENRIVGDKSRGWAFRSPPAAVVPYRSVCTWPPKKKLPKWRYWPSLERLMHDCSTVLYASPNQKRENFNECKTVTVPAPVPEASAMTAAVRSSSQCAGLIGKTLLSSFHPVPWPRLARIFAATVPPQCPCPTIAG